MSIEIGWTALADLMDAGLEDLAAQNYAEIECDVDRYPLDIDWQAAFAAERGGQFRTIGAFAGSQLVGYAAFWVHPHFHSRRSLTAVCDVVYIDAAHRARAGLRFLRRSEELLRGLGVRRVFIASRPSYPRLGDLLAKLGYSAFEQTWSKNL